MPTVLQYKYSAGGTNVGFDSPITIGHRLVLWQSARDTPDAGDVAFLTGQGWTHLATCTNSTGFERGGAIYWKSAEAVDEDWNLDAPDLEYVLLETDATVETPVVAAGPANTQASSASMDCGGAFTPAEGDSFLAIGGASVGASDQDYDTLPNPLTPYDGVDSGDPGGHWNSFSPLMWVGYLSDASASGSSYVVGATNARPRTYCGITILLASSPPPPEATPPIACALDDEDLAELVCIEASSLESWSIRIERQGTGSGHVRVHRSLSIANEAVVKKGNWIAVKIPQIQEDALFTFAMERLTTTIIDFDEGGGELMQVAGRGNLCYLERAKAYPRSFENGGPVTDLSGAPLHGPASTGNKAGQILRRSIDEWQSTDRGVADFGFRLQPIAHVTTDFDYDDDSDGNTWATTTMTEELSQGYVGDTGLNGIMELIGTNEIDIIMWPSFLLQGFNSYGRDLTGGAFGTGVVRFVRGENIAERLVRDEGRSVDPNLTVVEGQDNTFAFAEAPTAATSPHVEGYIKTFGTDTSALEAIGMADMARRVRQGESVQYRVKTPRFGQDPDEATGLYLPGPPGSNGQYWIGDTVSLNTGDGFRDYDEVEVRVEAIVITSDDAGDLEVTVELKAVTLTGRFGATTGTPGGAFGNGTAPGTGGGAPAPPPGDVIAGQHIIDPTDAHDASAISVVPFSTIASTNVQDALEELLAEAGSGVESGIASFLDHGSVGATETIDQSAAARHWITLDNDCTLTFSGAVATVDGDPVECSFGLYVEQNGTGGHAITWPASVIWPDETEPTLSTDPNSVELLAFATVDGGTVWYGEHEPNPSTPPPEITIEDEGTPIVTGPTSIGFTGDGVEATVVGTAVTVTIPGAGNGIGPILISDTPSTPLIFADLVQNEAQDDLVYADT